MLLAGCYNAAFTCYQHERSDRTFGLVATDTGVLILTSSGRFVQCPYPGILTAVFLFCEEHDLRHFELARLKIR